MTDEAVADPDRRLRIGFLTPWRVDDPSAWSGIIAPMLRALEEVADVVAISTADVRPAFVDRAAARVLRKGYLWDFGLATSRKHGLVATRHVQAARVDVVFAVAASADVAFLGGAVPVVQYVDAAFDDMKDRYSVFAGLSRLSAAQIRSVGRRAGRRTTGYVAASGWAADGLAQAGVPQTHVVVAPPGAAIEPEAPGAEGDGVSSRSSLALGPRATTPEVRAKAGQPAENRALRVLVVSSDWERKGGDRALAAVDLARSEGAEIALTVAGTAPALPARVRTPGRMSREELSAEYRDADVLLELARANAAGVTLTDAAAHSLPAIATNAGGTATLVAPGRSGWLVPNDETAVAEAAALLAALARGEGNGVSRATTSQWYQDQLGWDRWAHHVVEMCGRVAREEAQ